MSIDFAKKWLLIGTNVWALDIQGRKMWGKTTDVPAIYNNRQTGFKDVIAVGVTWENRNRSDEDIKELLASVFSVD